MKTLLVLRHAAAQSDGSAPTDFDRRLEPSGLQDAVAVGAMMAADHCGFDAIIASPAVRAVETIAGIGQGARRAVEPIYDPRAYNASPWTWLEIIREADDRFGRILLVGHNPGLQQLLLHLAEADGDGRDEDVARSFPAAALAELCLDIDHWRDIGPRSGRIVRFVRPGDRDRPAPRQE
jgi:phosphohistidine phosphatase